MQGEMSVASSNVNEPLFVSTTTECVLPSSRSASSAFDSSPPISQSIDVFLPRALVVVAAAPYKQEPERQEDRDAHQATALQRPADERRRDLDLVGRAGKRRGRRAPRGDVEHPRDRGDAGEDEPRSSPVRAAATPTSGNDQRCRSIAFRYVARVRLRHVELEDQLAGSSVVTSRSSSVGSR